MYKRQGPNGFTSTDENPSIPNATSAAAGTYSVTLISSNAAGSNSSVQPDYITVSAGADVAATATPEVTYTDSYTLAPTPVPADTFVIPAASQQATSSSDWLAQENQKTAAIDSETPANASGLTPVISLVSIAGMALFFRKKYQ